jgi:hypothetical protein
MPAVAPRQSFAYPLDEGDEIMSDYRDWTITLAFSVQPGDTEGTLTDAIFEAALVHAPSQAAGITARADSAQGKVWITFTLVNSSRGLADEIARSMQQRVRETVLSEDESCVTAS